MKEFDIEAAKNGAPVQTRDGRPARIICWDRKGLPYPIVVLIDNDGKEWLETYSRNGKFCIKENSPLYLEENSPLDLVMAPTKKEGWINIYPDYTAGVYNTKEEADEYKGETRVACVHVEWEE